MEAATKILLHVQGRHHAKSNTILTQQLGITHMKRNSRLGGRPAGEIPAIPLRPGTRRGTSGSGRTTVWHASIMRTAHNHPPCPTFIASAPLLLAFGSHGLVSNISGTAAPTPPSPPPPITTPPSPPPSEIIASQSGSRGASAAGLVESDRLNADGKAD